MKRIICAVLTAILLLALSACYGGIKEPVTFYFPRRMNTEEEFTVVVENGVLGSEVREASGHADDLRYLLSLYLRGPVDDNLKSPFPAETALLNIHTEESALIVTLNSAFTALEDMELTVACACVARTCFDLCDAESEQILAYTSGDDNDVDMNFSRDSLLMADESHPAANSAETTQ